MKAAMIAFSLYSRIPMPSFPWEDRDRKNALHFFPLVGCAAGIVFFAAFSFLQQTSLGVILRSALLTAVPLLFTGGIHMDGFMDTCDAMASWGDREKKLAILKDSHTGAFAVMACSLYLLLYTAGCTEFTERTAAAVSFGFPLSRSLCGLLISSLPQARETGMLSDLTKETAFFKLRRIMIGSLFVFGVLVFHGGGSGKPLDFWRPCCLFWLQQETLPAGIRRDYRRFIRILCDRKRAFDPDRSRRSRKVRLYVLECRMKLLFLRHGKTRGNFEGRYVGRTDEPLAPETRRTLLALSEEKKTWLKEQAGRTAAFYMSPMRRCLETAELLFPKADYPGVPRNQVPDLRECDFGRFEYKTWKELETDPDYQRFLDTLGESGFPEGETTQAFKERVIRAFIRILQENFKEAYEQPDSIEPGNRGQAEKHLGENEQNKEKTLVFIVHGGTIMTIFERFSGTKKGYYDWQTENLSGYLADAVLKNSPPQSLETALHLENIAQVKNL